MKKVAIVGFGREGRSALSYFRALGDTCTIFYYVNPKLASIDILAEVPPDVDTIEISKDTDFSGLLDNYDVVIRSADLLAHNIHTSAPISSNTIEFFQQCAAPIVGVTGTKGKGTTSTLVARLLEAAGKNVYLLGNIGSSPLDSLNSISADDWVVFELSSYQLSDLTISPHVAVHLMLEPDHLDVHTDMDEYANAKANIFAYQKPNDIAVYYQASTYAAAAVAKSLAKIKVPFDRNSTDKFAVRVKEGVILINEYKIANVDDIQLVGSHMTDNVCAAIAAYLPICYPEIVSGNVSGDVLENVQMTVKNVLQNFMGLPHRLQIIAKKHGITYVDDSISTNPSTAIAAIHAFAEPKILILGGSDKGNNFDELARAIRLSNIKKVILLGEMAERIQTSLTAESYTDILHANNLDSAVIMAAKVADSGDVVVLSPACASFDMFSSYTERGDIFTKSVEKLI